MSEHHLTRCGRCGDLAKPKGGDCTTCARRSRWVRRIHRTTGAAFWALALIAAGSAEPISGAAWSTTLTLAAGAGWAGVVWLLTNPALDDAREHEKENGQ